MHISAAITLHLCLFAVVSAQQCNSLADGVYDCPVDFGKDGSIDAEASLRVEGVSIAALVDVCDGFVTGTYSIDGNVMTFLLPDVESEPCLFAAGLTPVTVINV